MYVGLPLREMAEVSYVFKCNVIGDSGVGKSSILNQDKNAAPANSGLTRLTDIDGKKIELYIHVFNTVAVLEDSSSYLHDTIGILLVYDITRKDTFENLCRWQECIRKVNSNMSIILVGNKSDLESERKITPEEGSSFAEQHCLLWIETSAETGSNVSEIFSRMGQDVYQKMLSRSINELDNTCGISVKEEAHIYILVKDIEIESEKNGRFSGLKRLFSIEKHPKLIISSGELLLPIAERNRAATKSVQLSHNYRLMNGSKTTLYADDSCVALLNLADQKMLEEIKSPQDRISKYNHSAESYAFIKSPLLVNLELNSAVQISSVQEGNPFCYGIIKWIGQLPNFQGYAAGIEMEEKMEEYTDGTFPETGERHFICPPNRGRYYELDALDPDERFMDACRTAAADTLPNPLDEVPLQEGDDEEGIVSNMIQKYIGDMKGIQGHQNSCYLDATLFGLFALSDAFDYVFLEFINTTSDQKMKDTGELIWKAIICPLRRNGVVKYDPVMSLRNNLDELTQMEGINQDEKDPEEFLNMLFKCILKVKPFFDIRRPYGIESEYFVQLFVEYDSSMRLPTIGDLLGKMFREQHISFTKSPSKVLVQVPRFGKQYKMYEKIVPDLILHTEGLTDSSTESSTDSSTVSSSAELGLLSVICIETSHYVCFTRDSSGSEDRWIFFDSMANRIYDMFNIPDVTECTQQLNEWVYPKDSDLSRLTSTESQKLPEYVRRFTQDIYLCIYVQR